MAYPDTLPPDPYTDDQFPAVRQWRPFRRMHYLEVGLLKALRKIRKLENTVATDRELIAKMAAVLPVLADAVRAKDADIAQLREEAGRDEADDTAALTPIVNGLDALVAAVTPQAPNIPPVDNVEDVPVVVDPTTPAPTEIR